MQNKDFVKGVIPSSDLNGENLKVLIVHTRWNSEIVNELVKGAVETLLSNKVKPDNILLHSVPGAYELPFATKKLCKLLKPDSAISIGVLIKGSTMHFEYISEAVSHGLMNVGLELEIPVIFGLLTLLNEQQAGMTPDGHNHGIDWGQAAIEMAQITASSSKSVAK
ncbi:hypothetical protein HK099_000043 [Clydaea vesicula]|uniref:6,7-dimethyl-8-ribityllumazine synthase n=1 Tax=Clydaea vesicula TaxID=447962 RepID=A0AAD5UCA3_9FUNG|nr:hypothetical protein HK099_000043 [Clydaea vesicula]